MATVNNKADPSFPIDVPNMSDLNQYEDVAAGVTAQVLGTSGGKGDVIYSVTVFPESTVAGAITLYDDTAGVVIYPGGGVTALSSLIPFTIILGPAASKNGAWKITTGTNVHVRAYGNFTRRQS